MNDFHSGGTVCSPTRATVLTGRNHVRDCVLGVFGCDDMTQCIPDFEFAINKTFTIAHAVRKASPNYKSAHFGKWHLGSFYNNSEKLGGKTSSPITHGFDHFNSTLISAASRTTNCNCNKKWMDEDLCEYGHYGKVTHCKGGVGPAGNNCCTNYWTEDSNSENGVTNLTNFSGPDDSDMNAENFISFL